MMEEESLPDESPIEQDVEFIAQSKYLTRLIAMIFMPAMLLATNTLIIFIITFFVKQCQFRQVKERKPLNCTRLCNRVQIAFSI